MDIKDGAKPIIDSIKESERLLSWAIFNAAKGNNNAAFTLLEKAKDEIIMSLSILEENGATSNVTQN